VRTRAGIILEARFGPSWRPGKVLELVEGRSILEHCLRRLVRAGVAHVVMTTSNDQEDDALEAIARRVGAGVVRGDSDDVLGRCSAAARAFEFDAVVAATSNHPAVDVQAPGRVLSALRATRAEYLQEQGLPIGSAVEGITAAALHRAATLARNPSDRTHVTAFIRSHPDVFDVVTVNAPVSLMRPSLRLTVDTQDDLDRVRELFCRTRSDDPTLAALIAASGHKKVVSQTPMNNTLRLEVA
jgi:spore coat polysaccharide biosynthesis protein SpsF